MKQARGQAEFRNNFDLIRLVAASAVVFGHSYVLVNGVADMEPLRRFFGIDVGRIAVDAFFVISGFLVTGSLVRRASLKEFMIARALRVFPGLLVMLALTVFLLAPLVSASGIYGYFSDFGVYKHFARTAVLFLGVDFHLPGVFSDIPYPSIVNGSLWSLPIEVRMYALLAGVWLFLNLFKTYREALIRPVVLGVFVLFISLTIYKYFIGEIVNHHIRLGAMFFGGAALKVFERDVKLNDCIAVSFFALLIVVSAYARDCLYIIYSLVLPYIVFFIAHRRLPWLSNLRLEDVSYGIYIYSFPVQQLIVFMVSGISVGGLFLMSYAVTLIFAFASWRLVEKPALLIKSRLS